jgi:uncharacterized protein (DUF433 family)
MALPQSQPFPRIARDPKILHGEPVVEGTGVSVRTVVLALRYDGSLDEVAQHFPHVERSALEKALAYYEAHQEEIDEYIRASQEQHDNDDVDLERPEHWDWDTVERYPGNPQHATVVGVTFTAQEFQQVAAAAEAQGLSTSAYLRQLALGQSARAAS